MGIFFELLISMFFGVYYFLPRHTEDLEDNLNRLTYNVIKEKSRKTFLTVMRIVNVFFFSIIAVMAIVEIGSQVDLVAAAVLVVKIQLLVILCVHVTVALIMDSKRKKIVRELVREFERSERESYSDDALYEYVREHIIVTKKELTRMLRTIKRSY